MPGDVSPEGRRWDSSVIGRIGERLKARAIGRRGQPRPRDARARGVPDVFLRGPRAVPASARERAVRPASRAAASAVRAKSVFGRGVGPRDPAAELILRSSVIRRSRCPPRQPRAAARVHREGPGAGALAPPVGRWRCQGQGTGQRPSRVRLRAGRRSARSFTRAARPSLSARCDPHAFHLRSATREGGIHARRAPRFPSRSPHRDDAVAGPCAVRVLREEGAGCWPGYPVIPTAYR